MLNKVQERLAYHLQAMVYSFNLLWRKPIANFMTVLVVATTLVLPTLFWIFTDNMSQLIAGWKRNGHLSLYLQPSLSASAEKALLEQVQHAQGVRYASLKTAQQGLEELIAQEGMQDIMRFLPDNPLPAVIEVIPADDLNSTVKVDLLARQLRAIPQVDNAKIDMEWVGRLNVFLKIFSHLSNGVFALLALAVLIIIGNTLRFSIQNRQEEIQVLKLVGAADSFIARPFLYAGIWYGFGGAVIALLLVHLLILSLNTQINKLLIVYQMHYPLIGLTLRHILLLITFAIILGWLGAWVSVKKQLATIETYN